MQRVLDKNPYSHGECASKNSLAEMIDVSNVDEQLCRDWDDLVSRSVEANAFLAPSFVLPAIRHLHRAGEIFIVVVRDPDQTLIALGVFEWMQASRNVPFSHVRALKTIHSFRSGLLVDQRQIVPGLDGILSCLASQGIWGIDFDEQWLDSPLVSAIQTVCNQSKFHWSEASEYDRPVFNPADIDADDLTQLWSKNRRKSHKKNIRRLDDLGPWELRVIRRDTELEAGPEFSDAIERFVVLEHSGWKGTHGTSLRANPNEEQFFTSMMHGFAELDGSFFVELVSNDRVIGSTANLIAGKTAYAFKVGWDAEFASVSPGKILDAELMIRSRELLPQTQLVDSCAKGECYLAGLWPGRIRIGRGVLTLKRRSRIISTVVDQGRYAKRQFVGALANN